MSREGGDVMIICIAAENGSVCSHFGHCPEFVLFEVEGEEVRRLKSVANPGHAPGTLPPILKEWGVTHVVAGGMGARAVELFRSMGVEVYTGCQGGLEDVARSLAAGKLQSSGATCEHHGGRGHDCGHGGSGCH
jgi:predicted Fe-Mo cluster-binding NifX family protein